MEEFRLVYYHKETGKKYLGKMVTRLDYVLFDPDTKERKKVTQHILNKDYNSDPANKKSNPRNSLRFKKNLTKKAS